ncbi:hypothetical protein Tco_1465709 [Tanacetum coccineum]
MPNDIYNSVDACSDAKQMWNRIKRLMQGNDISKQERHSRLMNEFDKFMAVERESLTSVYERFSTLVNVMDWNNVRPSTISVNTKFLNSLQLEWSKYVTMIHQQHVLDTAEYDELYDHLSQFEPHVNASKSKKAARNHDSLALVSNSHAHSFTSHASSSYSRIFGEFLNRRIFADFCIRDQASRFTCRKYLSSHEDLSTDLKASFIIIVNQAGCHDCVKSI